MTELEKAYLAGILDGEGWISLSQQNRKTGHKVLMACVGISNTNLELLSWIIAVTGKGRVYPYGKSKIKRNHQCFVWRIHTRSAADFVAELYPYLIIKKKKAALVMRLYHEGEWAPDLCGQRGKCPPEEKERRATILEEFRIINIREHSPTIN